MFKKNLTVVLITACLGLIGVIFSRFETTMLLDRFNPLVHENISYARVAKGSQSYRNIAIFNPKTGKKLSYKLNCGYDPDRQYIEINHKGQYVKRIK